MSEPGPTAGEPPPPAAPPAAGGTIDVDLPCLSCDYNLRGLRPDGRCPECGGAVVRSLRAGLLPLSDPRWVARLAYGADLVFTGFVYQAVGCLCAALVLMADALFRDPDELEVIGALLFLAPIVMVPAGLVLALIGIVALSSPASRSTGPPGMRTYRRDVRGTLTIAVAGLISIIAVAPAIPELAPLVGLATAAATAGFLALLHAHVGQLAARLPSKSLRRSARICQWGLSLSWAMLAIPLALEAAAVIGVSIRTFRTPGRGVLLAVTGIAFIGFYAYSCILFRRCRRAFREAARQAAANWSEPGHG